MRYLTWDSSPQFRRDYQLGIVYSISYNDLPEALNYFYDLIALSGDGFDELVHDRDMMKENLNIMSKLQAMLQVHALPAVLVGPGSSSPDTCSKVFLL